MSPCIKRFTTHERFDTLTTLENKGYIYTIEQPESLGIASKERKIIRETSDCEEMSYTDASTGYRGPLLLIFLSTLPLPYIPILQFWQTILGMLPNLDNVTIHQLIEHMYNMRMCVSISTLFMLESKSPPGHLSCPYIASLLPSIGLLPKEGALCLIRLDILPPLSRYSPHVLTTHLTAFTLHL